MLHDPAINEQIYFRHIPMGIAYIVFFVLYVTTNYRGNLHFTITQNAKEQKELNTEVIGK